MRLSFILAATLLLVAVSAISVSSDKSKSSKVAHVDSGEQKGHHLKKSNKKYNHDHEKTQKGKSEVVIHKKESAEKGGKKHQSSSEGNHRSQTHNEGHGGHGASFKHGEKQKKAGFVKGFREQYHKDEQKKDDTWYSQKHKAGEWLHFGAGKSKHHASKHEKDGRGKYQGAQHADKHGTEKKYGGGHSVAEHRGHQAQNGGQSHHGKHVEYAKKKASPHGHVN